MIFTTVKRLCSSARSSLHERYAVNATPVPLATDLVSQMPCMTIDEMLSVENAWPGKFPEGDASVVVMMEFRVLSFEVGMSAISLGGAQA